MRVLIVIAMLVGGIFMILFVLADLVRELSHLTHHSSPDPDSSGDWDIAMDGLDNTAPAALPGTEQRPAIAVQNRIAGAQGYNFPGKSNALDDLRSAL
jgi:hypothetical protein